MQAAPTYLPIHTAEHAEPVLAYPGPSTLYLLTQGQHNQVVPHLFTPIQLHHGHAIA